MTGVRKIKHKSRSALMASEEKFRTVSDSAPDAIITVDNDGHVIFWNKSAEKIFGYAEKDAAGKPMHDLIIPERYRQEHINAFGRFRTTGEGPFIGKTLELSAMRKDGAEFPIELSLSGVKIMGRWCATGIIRDIARRKQAEEELQQRNAELKALYNVSHVLNRTIEMDKLIPEVLRTLAETEIFPVGTKAALFLNERGRMRFASSVGLPEAEPCVEIEPGKCLCGMALATGETIVSENSEKNGRHITCHYPDIGPHGHVIIPLRAGEAVLGIMTFFIEPDRKVPEDRIKLLSSMANQIGIAISNSRLYEEAKTFSLHDPLTGLANRRFLTLQIEKALESAKRYGEKLSVIMADIDYFKQYNDKYGHIEGDRLLVRLAGIILRETRKADYVFRYGGEEFLILMSETDEAVAFQAAERLRGAVEAEAGVTISLGVSTLTRPDERPEELIEEADRALYGAKQEGRNRVKRSHKTAPNPPE